MSDETNKQDEPQAQASESQVEDTAKDAETAKEQAQDESSAATADTADISSEEDLAEQLQAQLDKAREDVLRAAAEAQNARRRAEQDVEKARKFALERFTQDLLPVVDNLERAMSSADPEDEAIKPILEGVELTYKSFQDALSRHQVKVVDPAGEPFDPEQHQAMSMVPNDDVEPNTILEVFQKGYLLNGRLVRPAMVVVSKAPE